MCTIFYVLIKKRKLSKQSLCLFFQIIALFLIFFLYIFPYCVFFPVFHMNYT
jgi:hypothetical protein